MNSPAERHASVHQVDHMGRQAHSRAMSNMQSSMSSCFVFSPIARRIAVRSVRREICSGRTSSFLAVDEKRIANSLWVTQKHVSETPPVATSVVPHAQAQKLDGKLTAATIREEISREITSLVETKGEVARPGLAVVIVGERRDSQTYVRSKRKACEEVGIASFGFELPVDCTQQKLEEIVDQLNSREDVHGILIQLPLPDHIDDEKLLDRIKLEKDVDGFHPLNIGRLCMSGRIPPLFIPCTPQGCVELLDRYAIDIEGKNAVVIGRSNIVGLPVAMLLMHRNATVTICHSRTKDTREQVQQADIVIAACGLAEFVKADWLKPGAVVIDVGINPVEDATKKKGYRLVGDVEYENSAEVASYITPVPGGVGPMTIAMLLSNTLRACKQQIGEREYS
ncbi:Methylenetetrahydrofolate dehydrogenase [Gracilaria domingensis]|nr:Methylenetetrahydrofolate dehydrogenase [Gracilaria domingensis]